MRTAPDSLGRLSVRLPEEHHAALCELAEKLEVSVSALVQEAVEVLITPGTVEEPEPEREHRNPFLRNRSRPRRDAHR